MLTLTFLGVGSAFAKRNLQSNALIEVWAAGPDTQGAPDDTLLVDFGTTGPMALHRLMSEPGFGYLDRGGLIHYPAIRGVVVTHTHSDHIGGLEELAAMNMHCYGDRRTGPGFKPHLIASGALLVKLWDHSLSGGLGVVSGRSVQLDDYFSPVSLDPSGQGGPDGFTLSDRYEFSMVPTDHIRLRCRFDWPSFALLIRDRHSRQTVVYSGDTRFDPEGIGAMMAAARLNFHEVQLEDQTDPVHATLTQLRTLPETVRKKTILYHYSDAWDSDGYDFVAEEFAGFAHPHHRYILFE